MPSDDDFKAGQQALWNRMAAGWTARYDQLERLSEPVNRWLCDAAQLAPGMRVLDIASGSGQPALTAAARVAPGGRVTASDISDTMVAALNQRARAEGVENLEAVVADMDGLQFEDESFDAVTCRWGFMFSQQPVRALSEVRRVLRGGGVLSTATWDASAPVPLGTILHNILNDLAGLPPGREPLPTPLDTPEALSAILRRATFTDVAVERLAFSFDFESPADWWDFILELSTPQRQRIDRLSAEDLARARARFEEEAEKLRRGDRIVAPAVCVCASARK